MVEVDSRRPGREQRGKQAGSQSFPRCSRVMPDFLWYAREVTSPEEWSQRHGASFNEERHSAGTQTRVLSRTFLSDVLQGPEKKPQPLLHRRFFVRTSEERIGDATWESERDLHLEQEERGEKHRQEHISDATVYITEEWIDIEVQVSGPSPHTVERIMMESVSGHKKNPLQYYVNEQSERVVRAVYGELLKQKRPIRSRIEMIDLKSFLQSEDCAN